MFMDSVAVDIIMPAYNAANTIAQSIQSIIDQTFTNWQLIIINDCSKDNTEEIVQRYCKLDNRIKYFKSAKNMGVSYSRNYGISQSQNGWIAFLDSDDMWEKEKLEEQILRLKTHQDGVLFFTGSSFIDENNKSCPFILQVPEEIEFHELLKQNLISCSSVLVKKEYGGNFKSF